MKGFILGTGVFCSVASEVLLRLSRCWKIDLFDRNVCGVFRATTDRDGEQGSRRLRVPSCVPFFRQQSGFPVFPLEEPQT